ncbi:CD226 antigen-like isoform X22 [Xiphophorus couchianus]|nr:CD226 antigen-like isoform X22 [Xiphophorus couchianus]
MKDGDVSLLLSNVTTSDSGKYECRVFQREATSRKRRALTSDPIGIIFLDVAPPTVHKNISAVPGQNVSLPCRLPNNKPAVVVQWTRPDLEPEDVFLFRDEQPDPENQHPFFRNRVELQDRRMKDGDVSLLLSNVTTNDSGKYECRVFQREATGRKKRALTSDPIGIIFLDVAPPTENVEERKEDGSRNKHVGLIVGAVLIIGAVLMVSLIIGLILHRYVIKTKEEEAEDEQITELTVRVKDGSSSEIPTLILRAQHPP